MSNLVNPKFIDPAMATDAEVATAVAIPDLIDQSSTPANPAAGHHKVYTKTNGKLYRLDSSGVEVEIAATGGGGNFGAGLYQGHWAGSATIYWTPVTTGSWQEWAATGTPVLTQDYKSGFGTVSTAASARPGITFTAPATGTIKITFYALVYNSSGGTELRLVDGSGTQIGMIAEHDSVYDKLLVGVGFLDVTATTSYTVKLQVKATGATYLPNNNTTDSALSMMMEYVK